MFSNFWADSRAITENKCRLTQRGSQRVLHWLYIGCDVRPRTNKKQKFSPTMFGPIGFLRASSPSFVTIPLFSTDQDIQAQKTEVQKLLKPSLNWPWVIPILKKLNIQKQTYNLPQAGHDTILGQRTLTRYTKLTQSTAFLTCQIQQQLPQLTVIYNLLYSLGSDSIQKFVVSRLLEVLDVTQPSIFCCGDCHGTSLNLFTQELNSKCVWLCFDDTSPPTNMPMRISCPDDTFQLQIREWLLGFTHFRRHLFPPLHKPKAPFVHVKRRTWGQSLFNFQKWLQWWHSDDILPCACKQFPDHIQNQSRDLPHIAAWAAECYPDIPQLRLHIATAQPSTWTFFVPGNRGI